MTDKRSHCSFVSYIDRSRVYYAAQGYDEPYRWAHFDEVPFTQLPKPLDECRIGIATSADRGPRADGRHVRIYAEPHETAARLYTEMSWDRDATHMDDSETYAPIATLALHVQEGRVGSASTRFYGVPTEYSARRTLEEDAPRLEAWIREDGVDACLLVAI